MNTAAQKQTAQLKISNAGAMPQCIVTDADLEQGGHMIMQGPNVHIITDVGG